jgi:hypothetical protein
MLWLGMQRASTRSETADDLLLAAHQPGSQPHPSSTTRLMGSEPQIIGLFLTAW